ncbi:NAD(P)-dependent oxidoreductase [Cytobacillus sp. Hz8]|uniref:NAD(P)-dependent oxidoreductase n=1 Tax=Cytobacillus sp. Hz8 TaxID=3347168 RepID=UPI0035D6B286
MKIGFIGTGVMGSRMIIRLLDAGFNVLIYNRSQQKLEPLLARGAKGSKDIAALAEECDYICTCLSMPKDVLDVYSNAGGILENAGPDTVCLDFTTIGVETSRSIYQLAKEKKIHYLDAPVSGGPEGAEQGSLTIMVGGERSDYERVYPIIEVLGCNIEFLGESGSGSAAKLINQYLVAVHSVAASEAMVAGAAFGLNSDQLYQLLKVSYGDSRMLERHMEQYVLERQFEPGGAVKYVHKDVVLANQLFEKTGMERYLGQYAEQAFSLAMEQGLANLDMSAVIQPLEKTCRVIVKK